MISGSIVVTKFEEIAEIYCWQSANDLVTLMMSAVMRLASSVHKWSFASLFSTVIEDLF